MKFRKEYTAVVSLALIMAVRMLGLFMILPVFSIHSREFTHATPFLVGLTLGIYGLTQAIFQMPLATLSDRWGRKPVIAMGLCIFIIGSIVAALAQDIYVLIIGRALQGAGAVGSTVLAFVADLTREENRSKAMGIIGLAIGGSFAAAMVIGPLVNAYAGLSGIFWITAVLAVLSGLILFAVPKPSETVCEGQPKIPLIEIFKDPQLLRLDAGIFFLHAILTALFIAIPILLAQTLQLSAGAQIWLYLLVLILAFGLMLPPLIFAEKTRRLMPVFLSAIGLLFLAQLFLAIFSLQALSVGFLLLLFFTAFSLLEAVLPSWVSKITPPSHRGAAMGLYSTAQFLGIFAGGGIGGWIFSYFGGEGIFIFGAIVAGIWLWIAVFPNSQDFRYCRE